MRDENFAFIVLEDHRITYRTKMEMGGEPCPGGRWMDAKLGALVLRLSARGVRTFEVRDDREVKHG